jgi:hypothetical protein
MSIKSDAIAITIAGVVLLAAAWYAKKKVAKAADEILPLINPFDDRNLANQTAISIYQAVTGSKGTIGTDLYDVTHNGTFNPTSNNNILYPHNDNFSLGTWLYDVVH